MERNTKQQQQILEILKESKSHPTIKELCDLVNEKYPNIGQATIYRTINKLVLDNKILRIACPNGIHYDYHKEHYHFYCLRCGKIIDLNLNHDFIVNLLSTKDLNIFKVDLLLEGVCPNCSNSEVEKDGIK